MLSDNATETWPIQVFSPPDIQVGSNSEVHVGSIDSKTKKHRIALGWSSAVPSVPLRQNFFTGLGDNLTFPVRLGKDLLVLVGPATFPERFERNLSVIALAYDSIKARLVERRIQFTASLEVSRDPDHLDSQSLLVVMRISQMPYKEILKLWDELSFDFAGKLDKNLIGNVHLVLRRGD
jgi:hypothetical protein